jgi:hypothetical protein
MMASIALGLVGLILWGIAFFMWTRTREFIVTARSGKGTVIRMVSDSEGAYAPVFKFTASNGDSIEKQETVYSNPPSHAVGDVIDILYDPNHPQTARVAKTSNLYFAPILLAVIGLVFVASGAVWLGLRLLDVFF